MKSVPTVVAITVAAVAAAGAFAATPGPVRDANPAVSRSAEWLTIPAIYDKVTAAGYRDIDEIERERDGYEVKATDASGQRVKLYVDPLSGEILDARSKGAKRDRGPERAPMAPQGDGGRR